MVFILSWSPEDNADFEINDWIPLLSQFDDWDYARYTAFQSRQKSRTMDKCDSSSGGDAGAGGGDGGAPTKLAFKPAAWFSFEGGIDNYVSA